MYMTLFDKNKQQPSSTPDLSGIKQEAMGSSSPSSSQLPSFNSNPNTQNNNEFVNPFNSNQGANPNMNNQFDNSMNMNSYQDPTQQMPSFNSSSPLPSPSEDPMNMGGGPMGSYSQQPSFPSQPSASSLSPNDFISKEQAEEIIVQTVESVLEDKWEDITRNVRKVVEWKDKVESQVTLVKEDIVSLQDAFVTLEKRLISKLNNYDKSILDVGSEIKALDKVFQKVTPTLVNNVTELGRIAKDLKSMSHASKNFEE